MKRLMIMRHAKSSWKDASLEDEERPLNKRGRRDAPRIGAHLREIGWVPELVLCSSSMRTQETFARMKQSLGETDVRITDALYLCDGDDALGLVSRAPDEVETLMLLGHNPDFEDLVGTLTGRFVRMTTANVALLTSSADRWQMAVTGAFEFVQIVRPKELPAP